VSLVSLEAWFVKITEKMKLKCFQELASVKFSPELNLKSTEQTHLDLEKLRNSKKVNSKERAELTEQLGSYYMNIAEELNDFDEWCVSDQGDWGVPIPYFVRNDTGEVLLT